MDLNYSNKVYQQFELSISTKQITEKNMFLDSQMQMSTVKIADILNRIVDIRKFGFISTNAMTAKNNLNGGYPQFRCIFG